MKTTLLTMLVLVAIALVGCKNYDDDIDSLNNRVAALEEWQKTVNSNISSLQTIVSALEGKDYVTAVTALTDGTGYVLNFEKSGAVTIKHGTDGYSPQIGVKLSEEDGKHYWALDGDFLTDASGNKIVATGIDGTPGTDAIAPQVRINGSTNLWEISTDGGNTWKTTGVKATGDKGATGATGSNGAQGIQGDAIFAKDGIDNSNSGYVILTLADGTTKITLPRYKAFKIGTDSGNDALAISSSSTTIPLSLPSGFKESDYTAIMAQVVSNQGTGTDIKTRASTSPWSVTVNKPTFTNGNYNNDASVTVTLPNDAAEDEAAILEVTLVNSDGSKTTATRALKVVRWDGTTKTAPAVGDGSEANPYLISTGANLAYIAQQVNNGTTYEGKYIKLTNDINLNDKEWTPIGKDESQPFKGNFDGNGKAIKGFKMTPPIDPYNITIKYIGLFGCVDGGKVSNVYIEGEVKPGQFEKGTYYVGGIIGYLKSGSVSNLSADVKFELKSGGFSDNHTYVGGAIGKSDILITSDLFQIKISLNFNTIQGKTKAYIGRNVGWCNNFENDTKLANNYVINDESLKIPSVGYGVEIYINGYIIR